MSSGLAAMAGPKPAHVLKAEKQKAEALGEVLVEQPPQHQEAVPSEPPKAWADVPVKPPTPVMRKKVSIENDTFKYDFYVLDADENDFSIVFFIEKDQFTITPKVDSEFELTYNGIPYKVLFTGTPFYFQSIDKYMLLFIKEREND
jgi:hypothetical protein